MRLGKWTWAGLGSNLDRTWLLSFNRASAVMKLLRTSRPFWSVWRNVGRSSIIIPSSTSETMRAVFASCPSEVRSNIRKLAFDHSFSRAGLRSLIFDIWIHTSMIPCLPFIVLKYQAASKVRTMCPFHWSGIPFNCTRNNGINSPYFSAAKVVLKSWLQNRNWVRKNRGCGVRKDAKIISYHILAQQTWNTFPDNLADRPCIRSGYVLMPLKNTPRWFVRFAEGFQSYASKLSFQRNTTLRWAKAKLHRCSWTWYTYWLPPFLGCTIYEWL